MNVSINSGASSVWSLLASRASAASSSSSSSSSTTSSYSSTSSDSTTTQRPDGPPPPPSQFDCQMSTQQFAGQGGGMAQMGPPPEDPIASLDSDDDGSVSADEFGLDGASEDVQNLFSAIDEDDSGDLSTDEIDAFREQMMAADGGRPPEPPMGPPPGAQGSGSSSSDDSDDSSTSTASASNSIDVSSFIQQLAQRYASLTSTTSDSELSITA